MLRIEFEQGDIFDLERNITDVIAFVGHNGMAFGRSCHALRDRFPVLHNLSDPFVQMPFELIPISDRYLCHIRGGFMTDDDCARKTVHFFDKVPQERLHSIALNGVRNSKESNVVNADDATELDNNRVRFIVETIKDWIMKTKKRRASVVFPSSRCQTTSRVIIQIRLSYSEATAVNRTYVESGELRREG